MKGLIYLLLLFMGMGVVSCRSIRYVPVETVRTEYRTRDSIRYDSIYQRDSVFLYHKGDTVYQYRDRYLYRYLTLNRTDTVMRTDTIRVPYPVEKELSRWQSLKLELGGWAFGVIIALMLVIVGWFVYKARKK